MMSGFEIMAVSPILFWSVAGLAVFSIAISKSGFGGALGAMSTPILLFVLPPKLAIGVLLPLFLVTDVWVVYMWWRFVDRRLVLIMCCFGLLGQFVGWALFDYLDDAALTAIIGIIAVFTAISYFRKVFFGKVADANNTINAVARKIWRRAPLWCGLSGISSFVSLSGGIPAQIFLLPHALVRQAFVATMSVYFLVINLGKLPLYMDLQLFTPTSLYVSLWLLPIIPVGVMVGKWLNARMSDRLFYHISHIILFIMGIKLLYGAAS